MVILNLSNLIDKSNSKSLLQEYFQIMQNIITNIMIFETIFKKSMTGKQLTIMRTYEIFRYKYFDDKNILFHKIRARDTNHAINYISIPCSINS